VSAPKTKAAIPPRPKYAYVTLLNAVPSPKHHASTFTFSTGPTTEREGGFLISRDSTAVYIEWPPTGEVIEVPWSGVKELRRTPPPKEPDE